MSTRREILRLIESAAQPIYGVDEARIIARMLLTECYAESLSSLIALPDEELAAAGKKLNELREMWKNLGSVPKEKSEEINPRYLELTRKLQHKVDEFFARKRQMQKIILIAFYTFYIWQYRGYFH